MTKDFNKFANSFQAVARLGLQSIRLLLEKLDNPQNSLKFIHIAGTNGKGSVCSFLQAIFTEAGYKTGKYTSPNLISVCERISIDGKLISQSDIKRIMETVKIGAEEVSVETGTFPTQFEIWTAAAFCYFKEQACDIVVLETGLGGAQDATNIIPPPLASVITRIEIDHTDYLGNTIEEIASAKAGIIKVQPDNAPGLTISAIQMSKAKEVLSRASEERNNQLIIIKEPEIKSYTLYNEIFNFHPAHKNSKQINDITCGICGFYQPENAALAIETAQILGISEEHIKKGIKKATHPGRFEIIENSIPVIYDGAHNLDGTRALIKSIRRYFPHWNGGTFIMSCMADKDISGSFIELKNSGLCENSSVFTVMVKYNPRAALADDIRDTAISCGLSAESFTSVRAAYDKAVSLGKPVIICGSLYLYKDCSEEIKGFGIFND